jgi:hypothetical protein
MHDLRVSFIAVHFIFVAFVIDGSTIFLINFLALNNMICSHILQKMEQEKREKLACKLCNVHWMLMS